MAQSASEIIPPKGLWTLKIQDFFKGLWLAIGTSVLSFVYFLFKNHFKVPTWDQADPYLDTVVIAFLTYLAKNFGTNNVGELLKPDRPVVTVDKQELEKL
jgi:hypothetical protein